MGLLPLKRYFNFLEFDFFRSTPQKKNKQKNQEQT